jgi:AsmA protein
MNGTAVLDPDAGRYRASALGFRGWAGGDPLPLAGVELSGRLGSVTWDAPTQTGALRGGSFNLAGVPGEFAVDLSLGDVAPRMNLSVKTETFAPRAPAVAFGRPLPATRDPEAFGAVQATFTCALGEGVLRLDPIEAQLDDTRITGSVVPQERLVRLRADQIDLDRYLAPGKESRREKKATLEAAVASLRALDLDAEIRIAEAKVAGAKLRDTVVRIEREAPAP